MEQMVNNLFNDDPAAQQTIEEYTETKSDGSSNKRQLLLELITDPDIQLDPEYILPRFEMLKRKCYITGDIDQELSLEITRKIQFWNTDDSYASKEISERQPIMIYIDSSGGDVTSTFQIVDAILTSKTPVYTIVTGEAMSGGFLIAIVGDKRTGFSHSSYMIHEGACECEPLDAHKFLQHAESYKKTLDQFRDLILQYTDITEEQYDNNKKNDWYFTAQEAVKYGIIDDIATDVNGGIAYEE